MRTALVLSLTALVAVSFEACRDPDVAVYRIYSF
jgi:hypothetical protein